MAQGTDAVKFGERLAFTNMGELRIGVKEPCQQANLNEYIWTYRKYNLKTKRHQLFHTKFFFVDSPEGIRIQLI